MSKVLSIHNTRFRYGTDIQIVTCLLTGLSEVLIRQCARDHCTVLVSWYFSCIFFVKFSSFHTQHSQDR